ncbi:hypothetical protein FOL47_011333, partial [Perkinsus chesapeaki]
GVKPSTDREWQDMLDKITGELNNAPISKASGLSAVDVLLQFPATDLLTGVSRGLPANVVKIWNDYRQKCMERSVAAINVQPREIRPGQLVYLKCNDHAPKLAPRFEPVTVKEILGPNRIRLTNGNIVHSKDLKVLQHCEDLGTDDDSVADDDDVVSDVPS